MSRRNTKAAIGSYRRDDIAKDYPQIVIRFDRDTFDRILTLASGTGSSFNEQALTLITAGLEAFGV